MRAITQPQALQIDNKGLGAVDLVDVRVQGRDAQSFAVGNSCDGIQVPRALACRLLVQFKPQGAGAHEATIAIRIRDVTEPILVPVRGLATATPVAELLHKPSTSVPSKSAGARDPPPDTAQRRLRASHCHGDRC